MTKAVIIFPSERSANEDSGARLLLPAADPDSFLRNWKAGREAFCR